VNWKDIFNSQYEVGLIEVGAADARRNERQRVAEQSVAIVAVRVARNHGHQLALSAGLAVCRAERNLIIAVDLQDPAEQFPEMMRKKDQAGELVNGRRMHRAGEGSSVGVEAARFPVGRSSWP
jgi:dolichol-phosphate mannosyltransferase